MAGVEPRFVEWAGTGSPVEWVIATNLTRRHLTTSQRAVVALDLLPLLEPEAKERQRRSQGRGEKGAKQCATSSGNGKASEVAVRLTRSNSRYVETVKAIQASAPEVIAYASSEQDNTKRPADQWLRCSSPKALVRRVGHSYGRRREAHRVPC
jgi:hypothetical protein